MVRHSSALVLAVSILVLGCGGSTGADGASGGGGGTTGCGSGGVSELGILINFPKPVACTFTLAEAALGISIGYQVVIEADVSDVTPQAQSTCAEPGASGLFVFEQITGNGESYCICDSGLCPEPPQIPKTLKAGTYPGTFLWDGKNWAGPSDTGNPKGAPFPPGKYTLHVSTTGQHLGQPFEVYGELDVTLTP